MTMWKLLLTTTALAATSAVMALASPMTDSIVAQLQAQGFDRIEVREGPNQVKVEASNGSVRFEAVYDLATGAVLKQETYAAGADDDLSPGVDIESDDRDFVDGADDEADDSGSDDGMAGDGNEDDESDDRNENDESDGDSGNDDGGPDDGEGGGSDDDGGSDDKGADESDGRDGDESDESGGRGDGSDEGRGDDEKEGGDGN
jgi:hypothetical protein